MSIWHLKQLYYFNMTIYLLENIFKKETSYSVFWVN